MELIRTPDQRVRVFVSSTLGELATERGAAKEAITELRMTPVMFELGASAHPPRELYRSYLSQSDVFVGIYWERYGWVAPGMPVSGLEDEYQLSEGMPRLMYIKEPAPHREPRLTEMINGIQGSSYRFFRTVDELRQLIADDLATLLSERFSAPPSSVQSVYSPIPVPRDVLIGRQRERALAAELLLRPEVGIVTLTGPGGVGKTRLAMQVATDLVDKFGGNVAYVPLGDVRDPALVEPTIAHALGLSALDHLPDRDQLIVLDNMEQLIEQAPLIARAVELAPRLKLLVTSREPLRVRGERLIPIEPLDDASAIELFVERAAEAQPGFTLSDENEQAVREICRRLDGLPLALELGAVRLSLLSPEDLLQRLDLALLNRGARDLPERQQTLHNTITWSYNLLDDNEKRLFRRLAVFVSGFTLQAAQQVCVQEGEPEALELLGGLLDKSLVRSMPDTRFGMLTTIREFAYERLTEAGELEETRSRHAHYFAELAEHAQPNLNQPKQEMWLDRLEGDNANIRAAFEWAFARPEGVDVGLRLVGSLYWYWFLRGYVHEGRSFAETAVGRSNDADESFIRGKALTGAGLMALADGDMAVARQRSEQALAVLRQHGDKRFISWAMMARGMVDLNEGDYVSARTWFEQAYELTHAAGEAFDQASGLYMLGTVNARLNDLVTARAQLEQALNLFNDAGDVVYASVAMTSLQTVLAQLGDKAATRTLSEQSLAWMRRSRNPGALAVFTINIGDLFMQQFDDVPLAETLYRKALRVWDRMRTPEEQAAAARALSGLAEIAANRHDLESAGKLFGAALRFAAAGQRPEVERRIAAVRAAFAPDPAASFTTPIPADKELDALLTAG